MLTSSHGVHACGSEWIAAFQPHAASGKGSDSRECPASNFVAYAHEIMSTVIVFGTSDTPMQGLCGKGSKL